MDVAITQSLNNDQRMVYSELSFDDLGLALALNIRANHQKYFPKELNENITPTTTLPECFQGW